MDKKLAVGLAVAALAVVGASKLIDTKDKDKDPAKEKKHLVREFKQEDGGKLFGFLEAIDGGEKIVAAPPQCVIPVCDESEKPVDCLRSGKWRGCNVMPKEEASGSECKPASCWIYFGEENGK